MDILKEIVKNINFMEQIKAYIKLKGDAKSLNTKLQELHTQKGDVELKVKNAERSGTKKRTGEVEHWLKTVEEIDKEFKALDDRIQEGGLCWLFRNICSPGDVAKMDARVKDLIEQHQHFGELWLDAFENKGVPRLTTKLIGQRFSEGLESIKKWLVTDKIPNIGIHGMGGVGKTTLTKHIHNYLLEETAFKVHWITISQGFSIKELQDDIAKLVKIDLSDADDEDTRAHKLSSGLEQCVLVLDDVWREFDFKKIGVFLDANKCRLILTTRSLGVCNQMNCQKSFEVKTLDARESWELFKCTLDTQLPVEVEKIAESVAKMCAGLPLAIVTVARSMKAIDDIHEWRNAWEDLKGYSIGHEEMERKVFSILEWSFKRLKNEYEKRCFLYCSLYPEDWVIEREELVNLFIGAELIKTRDTRQSEFDQGHTILNELVRVGLLEKTSDWKDRECVKMHDLIRCMAIRITSGKSIMEKVPRFLVKSKRVDQKEWTKDLDAVSIWYMEEEIPADMSPKCPELSTLLFCDGKIKTIPDSFFKHMDGLKVLNLEGCRYLTKLPNCVSERVNLTALILQGCENLAYVPPLGKLKQLRELNLSGSGIKHIPKGLEELVRLESLEMDGNLEEEIPADMSPKCPKLLTLLFRDGTIKTIPDSFFRRMDGLKVLNLEGCRYLTELPNCVSERVNLTALILQGCENLAYVPPLGKLKQLRELNLSYSGIKHLPEGLKELINLESLEMVGTDLEEKIIPKGTLSKLHRLKQLKLPIEVQVCDPKVLNQLDVFHGNLSFTEICEPFKISRCPKHYALAILGEGRCSPYSDWNAKDKSLVFYGCYFRRGFDAASLLKDIQYLEFNECVVEQSNVVFQILNSSNDLLDLKINSVEGVEFLLKASSPPPLDLELIAIPYGPLPNLKTLYLEDLPDLVGLFDYKLPLPPGTFSSLEFVRISRCHKIRKLFTVQLLQSLKYLEELNVRDCKELEEIIGADEEDARGSGPTNTLTLPPISKLYLSGLPRLKNICKATIIRNSIKQITVSKCPNMKRLPLFLPINDGQPSPGTFLTLLLEDLPDFLGFLDNQLLLPPGTFSSLEFVRISRCHKMRKLFTVQMLQSLKYLKTLDVSDCEELEEVIGADEEDARGSPSTSSGPTNTLRKLPLPPGTFSSLEFVRISRCHKMRKLFTVQLLQSLKNLKELHVINCKELKEIIGADEEEASGSPSTSSGPTNTLTLPQLSELNLSGLPRLKNICKATIICNSMEYISVRDCPNVKRLPLFLPINSGQPSPPNTLKYIKGQKEWWESLEWDDPSDKITLHPFFYQCKSLCKSLLD